VCVCREVLTCESYDEVLGPSYVPSSVHRFRSRDPIQNLGMKITLTKVKEPDQSGLHSPKQRRAQARVRAADESPNGAQAKAAGAVAAAEAALATAKEGEDPEAIAAAQEALDEAKKKQAETSNENAPSPPASPQMTPGAPGILSPTTPLPSSPIPKSLIKPTSTIFRWQQKVFGRVQLAELRDEKRKPNNNAERALMDKIKSEDYSRQQRGLERLQGSPIFSVVDTEGPTNPFNGDWAATDNGLAPPHIDRILDLTSKKDRSELKFWEPFEGMAIFAEIEKPKNSTDGEEEEQEVKKSYHQPLLYIKHKAGGLVEMQPCFNDDEKIVHQFTTPYGVVYHYQIENITGLNKAQRREAAAYDALKEESQLTRRANIVGNQFSSLPAWPTKRVYVFGEIVSATGFDVDNASHHFGEAQVVLPSRITLDQAAEAKIVESEVATQMSAPRVSPKGVGTWNFALPFELTLVEMESGASHPRLYVCINSVDNWQRHRVEGYTHIDIPMTAGMYDLNASAWKPSGTIRESMQDFFIGGALQLVNRQHPAPPGSIQSRCLSYHGFEAHTTGEVRVRLNVVVQHSGAQSTKSVKKDTFEGPIVTKETQAEIEAREMQEMELRARLVKRAQDRVSKYSMLDANSIKKNSTKRRTSISKRRNSVERATEPASLAADSTPQDGAPAEKGAPKLSRSRQMPSRRGRAPRKPAAAKETVEANPALAASTSTMSTMGTEEVLEMKKDI